MLDMVQNTSLGLLEEDEQIVSTTTGNKKSTE